MRLKENNKEQWDKLKFKIKNAKKNVINIDTTDSGISSADSDEEIWKNQTLSQ